jgi:hypothetical protein
VQRHVTNRAGSMHQAIGSDTKYGHALKWVDAQDARSKEDE